MNQPINHQDLTVLKGELFDRLKNTDSKSAARTSDLLPVFADYSSQNIIDALEQLKNEKALNTAKVGNRQTEWCVWWATGMPRKGVNAGGQLDATLKTPPRRVQPSNAIEFAQNNPSGWEDESLPRDLRMLRLIEAKPMISGAELRDTLKLLTVNSYIQWFIDRGLIAKETVNGRKVCFKITGKDGLNTANAIYAFKYGEVKKTKAANIKKLQKVRAQTVNQEKIAELSNNFKQKAADLIVDGVLSIVKKPSQNSLEVKEMFDSIKKDNIAKIIQEQIQDPAPPTTKSPLITQVGGNHYTCMAIQPIEYILANNIGFAEGSIIKYISRYKLKNGIQDLKKAKHFIDILISQEETK